MKKKIGIIIAVVVIIAAAAGGGAWYFLNGNMGIGNSADKVYVEKVSSLNVANAGVQNRYSGVVEAQESWKVNKEPDREIKEVFVEQGDMVEEGDSLFEYNMDDLKSELSQAELELEGLQNEITDLNSQITQLTKERNAAPSEEKFQYTAEIQEKENSIKQTEYNIESKKAEMKKKQESIDNAVVTSKIAGVVKSINSSSGGGDYASEEESAYMTILAVGDFRVKGTVSESNVQMLSEQQEVILRSRVDENQTWTGTISKIDTQNEASDGNNDMMMYDSGGGTEKATKYPFYVTMDSTDGLMMGQHLFIELDEGQTEEKEGIWLFEGYIVRGNAQDGMGMGSASGDAQGLDFEESMDIESGGSDLSFDDAGMEGSSADEADSGEANMDGSFTDEADSEDVDSEDSSADETDSEGALADETDSEESLADAESSEEPLTDIAGQEEASADSEEGKSGTEGPTEEESPYVWAMNDRNRLEKRQVELGEYDEAMGAYEILSGLTEDDYIAFPMEGLYEGVTAVMSVDEVDYTSPLYNQGEEGEASEDGEPSEDGGMMKDGGFETDGEMMDESMSDMDMSDESISDEEDMSGEEDMSSDDESEDGASEDNSSGDGTSGSDSSSSGGLPSMTDTLGGDSGGTDLGDFGTLQ